MGEVGAWRYFVGGNLEGKRPFGRPTHKWEDNIKTELHEVG
jgi:hypothetical protein